MYRKFKDESVVMYGFLTCSSLHVSVSLTMSQEGKQSMLEFTLVKQALKSCLES